MAKKNRPAHGGMSFHKCGADYLFELHDSNGEVFAHCALDAATAAYVAGAVVDQLAAELRGHLAPSPAYSLNLGASAEPPPAPPPPPGRDYSGNRV